MSQLGISENAVAASKLQALLNQQSTETPWTSKADYFLGTHCIFMPVSNISEAILNLGLLSVTMDAKVETSTCAASLHNPRRNTPTPNHAIVSQNYQRTRIQRIILCCGANWNSASPPPGVDKTRCAKSDGTRFKQTPSLCEKYSRHKHTRQTAQAQQLALVLEI